MFRGLKETLIKGGYRRYHFQDIRLILEGFLLETSVLSFISMSAVLNHDHFFHVVYNNLKVSNIYAFKSVGDLGENRGGCYLFVCWVFFYPEMEGTFKRYLKSIVARLSQVPARLSKGT